MFWTGGRESLPAKRTRPSAGTGRIIAARTNSARARAGRPARGAVLRTAPTIGLDIAKSVFQVHGVDAIGKVVIRRQLERRYVLAVFEKLPPCVVGIEACATSHHWSRELKVLGHTVRLMPPAYVKPYVKRQKNDAADAEAICEEVTRANMRLAQSGVSLRVTALVAWRRSGHERHNQDPTR